MRKSPVRGSPLRGIATLLVLVLAVQLGACARDNTGPDHPGFADPIMLNPGDVIGRVHFPTGNSAAGGQGQPIGGVDCIVEIGYHIHSHLALFFHGEQYAIPPAVGITNPRSTFLEGWWDQGDCYYWVHTHDASGTLHVEPPTQQDSISLGQFFDVWGHPLTRSNVAGLQGNVTAFVDGVRYNGDLRSIVLSSHRHITLFVGLPLVPLPRYNFLYAE